MSRKDYVAIAAALAGTRPKQSVSGSYLVWARSVERVADVLARDNPRFDRERFITACNEEAT